MVDKYGDVYCIIIAWRFELYHHYSEHAYKRNEHDSFASSYLGYVLYRSTWRIIVPCIIIRRHSPVIRQKPWNKFLPE